MINRLLSPFKVNTQNEELMRAQLAAFAKQVPLLYFILIANVFFLAFTHYQYAPIGLTLFFPGCLIAVCATRAVVWLRARNEVVTDRIAERLKQVVRLAGVIGVLFLVWTFSLFYYGNAYTQSHITFFLGLTVISCVFSLMHLRPAALVLTVAVIPFTLFLFQTGELTFIAIGVNLLLVVGAMVYILLIVSRDFERMVNGQIETQRLSDENFRLANLDTLTGLPNRRQFFSYLDALLERDDRKENPLVVGLIDLDGFKPVNDLYGHVVGDQVLTQIGKCLQDISNETTFFARLGGDEFGIILNGACEAEDALALGERICTALQVPFSMPGNVVSLSGSVGFAMFPEAGESSELLYERADYALYHAKQNRRGRPVIFSRAHETELRRTSVVEQCLRSADLDAEMSLHFQPLFDVVQNKPIAFEALARWNSPELGNVPPNVFIAVAERTEIINKLTQTLLRKALAAARNWPDDIQVSFNLSVRDLVSSEAILQIVSIVRNSGIAPHRIDFEVTESAFMGDFDQAQESIRALKALGAKVSLDDFGTGYSSLSYVHRLPLDKIKVDRSFITDIETESTSRDVVRTVVDLCRNLKIGCVVEGMETEVQVEILRELGCKTMQGYLFSKPIPHAEVLGFLSNTQPALQQPKVAQSV